MANERESTPTATTVAAKILGDNLLPKKSTVTYTQCYEHFVEWQNKKQTTSVDEDIMLLYFDEMSKKFKPTSLWAKYSMLKSTVRNFRNVDMSKYSRLLTLLRNNSKGFKSTKSKTLKPDDVEKFLTEAADDQYLAIKVALILGITGACRREELKNITVHDIEHHKDKVVIRIPDTEHDVARKFTVDGAFYQIFKKYAALRPKKTDSDRFFLCLRNGKCTQQVIGINTFGAMPKVIAKYLGLKDPEKYTSHSFRRTSAKMLADGGADLMVIKQCVGWKSDRMVREFVSDSMSRTTSIQTRSQAFSYVDVSETDFTGFDKTVIDGPSDVISAQQSFWPNQATVCLIAQYKKFHSDPAAQLKNGESLFEMISSEMEKYGFYFDPQKCENEWRILEKKYKSLFCNEAIKEPGGMTHCMEWEHKKSMDEIFNEKNEQSLWKKVSLEESHFLAASTATEIAQNDDQGDYSSHFSTPSTATEMNPIDDQGDYSSLPVDDTEFDYEDVEMDKPDISMMSQTLLAEMNTNFLRAEDKKAERHKEKMAMRQQELELSKELLKLKKEKMELWKKQMLANGHLNVSETSK